jgi:uncharacterized protein
MRYKLWFSIACVVLLLLTLTSVSACNKTPEPEQPPETTMPAAPATEEPITSDSPPAPPATEEPREYTFLWEIKSDTTRVHLLGSIHVGSLDIYPLAQSIEDAYDAAEYLVLEIDTSEISDDEAAIQLIRYGLDAGGSDLSTKVSEELYTWLTDEFARFDVDLSLLASFRPWVISLTLNQFQVEELGYEAQYGIDMYFQNQAIVADKEILELESAAYQFEVLSSIPDDLWVLDLEKVMQKPLDKEEMERLYDAWLAGDTNFMAELVFAPLNDDPRMAPIYEVMFDVRNAQMLEKIMDYLADNETYFVIVGAGHLVGENGLLKLLEEQGYTVTQVERR